MLLLGLPGFMDHTANVRCTVRLCNHFGPKANGRGSTANGFGSKPMVPFWVGAPPILVYFSGDWDVHWGYGILTHGQIGAALTWYSADVTLPA